MIAATAMKVAHDEKAAGEAILAATGIAASGIAKPTASPPPPVPAVPAVPAIGRLQLNSGKGHFEI